MHQPDLFGQRPFPTSLHVAWYPVPFSDANRGTFHAYQLWSKGKHSAGNIRMEIEASDDGVLYDMFHAAYHGFTRSNSEYALPKEVKQAYYNQRRYADN